MFIKLVKSLLVLEDGCYRMKISAHYSYTLKISNIVPKIILFFNFLENLQGSKQINHMSLATKNILINKLFFGNTINNDSTYNK